MPSRIPATHYQLLGDRICAFVSLPLYFPFRFVHSVNVGMWVTEHRSQGTTFRSPFHFIQAGFFVVFCLLVFCFCNFRTTEYSSLAGPRVSRLSSCVHLPPSYRDVEIDRGLQPWSSFSCSFWGLNSGHQAVQQTLFHTLNPSVGCLSFFLFQCH